MRAPGGLFSRRKEAYNLRNPPGFHCYVQRRKEPRAGLSLCAAARTHAQMDTTGNTNLVSTPAAEHQEKHHHWTGGLHLSENLHHLRFPTFKHEHPTIRNVNELADEQLTMGAKIADGVASLVGSWRFIIGQSIILTFWVVLNSIAWAFAWDPRPFILLNLVLSFQAAYSAPFVMMSQNRQAEKDRLTAQNDYLTDVKGEQEITHILEHLDHQDALIIKIIERLEAQHEEMLQRLSKLDPALAQQVLEEASQPSDKQDRPKSHS